MAGNLDRIFAGVGMRTPEHTHKHLIERFPSRIAGGTEPDRIGGRGPDRAGGKFNHPVGNRKGIRAGHPDDSDSAGARQSRRGDNRLIQIKLHNPFTVYSVEISSFRICKSNQLKQSTNQRNGKRNKKKQKQFETELEIKI